MRKLKILADSAKYDVSCSTSGVSRKNDGRLGNTFAAGICHSWSADGRCISLLKVLFTNRCVYDCAYCVNRRSADCERASFEPRELADLTIEFYRRNYIEGLFLSSAVERSPDYTAERILRCLSILRYDYGFAGYIHAKIIPGASPELVEQIGLVADRVSVNIELPTEKSLALLAPQKKPAAIFRPMKQITNTLIERRSLVGPGVMFRGEKLNTEEHYIRGEGMRLEDSAVGAADGGAQRVSNRQAAQGGRKAKNDPKTQIRQKDGQSRPTEREKLRRERKSFVGTALEERLDMTGTVPDATQRMEMAPRTKRSGKVFAPAGQTTQLIVGAGAETDRQILKLSEDLYRIFKMKRVFFSAYIPVNPSPLLPDLFTAPPLAREHRIYQADWLLRFYGFRADEILDERRPFLDAELDPKIMWALRHMERFPIEINKAPLEDILRIPGIGTTSAYRIVRQRRHAAVRYEDLRRMGVVLKRARYFLTCSGRFYGGLAINPEKIREELLHSGQGEQLSMFSPIGIFPGIGPSNDGGRTISKRLSEDVSNSMENLPKKGPARKIDGFHNTDKMKKAVRDA